MTATNRSALLVLADELDSVRAERDQLRAERDAVPATHSDALTTANARAEALHAALTQAVAFAEKVGREFMRTEDQAALRVWRALLAEGRR